MKPLDQPEEVEKVYPYEKNMGFFDHVDELRKRLVRTALVILIGFVGAFCYITELTKNIVLYPFDKSFPGYKWFCSIGRSISGSDALCFSTPELSMQNLQVQGQFVSAFKIAFVVGIIVAFPYLVYQLWKFVRPALSPKEIRKTRFSMFWVSFLFFLGLGFAYFFLTPLTLNFLMNFKLIDQIENIYTIQSAVGYVTFLSLATGLVFELPVLIYVLARIGLVTGTLLKKYWRYAVVVIFLLAGIATPSPDIFSQLVLGTPLLLLYVIGVVIASRIEKQKLNEN